MEIILCMLEHNLRQANISQGCTISQKNKLNSMVEILYIFWCVTSFSWKSLHLDVIKLSLTFSTMTIIWEKTLYMSYEDREKLIYRASVNILFTESLILVRQFRLWTFQNGNGWPRSCSVKTYSRWISFSHWDISHASYISTHELTVMEKYPRPQQTVFFFFPQAASLEVK